MMFCPGVARVSVTMSKTQPKSADRIESLSSDKGYRHEGLEVKCVKMMRSLPLHQQFESPGMESRNRSLVSI
jgi:hypothetical protein